MQIQRNLKEENNSSTKVIYQQIDVDRVLPVFGIENDGNTYHL